MPLFQSTLQRRWVLFAVFFLASAIAKAALVSYIDRGVFVTAVGTGTTVDFETGNSPATGDQGVSSRAYPAAAFTITTEDSVVPPNNLFVLSAASNPSGLAMTMTDGGLDFFVTFGSGVTAVGADFFLTTGLGARLAGTLDITFTFSASSPAVLIITSTGGSGDPAGFGGYSTVGETITSMTISPSTGFATVDNVTVVPELPSTGIAAALLCLLVAGRVVVKGVCSKLRSPVS